MTPVSAQCIPSLDTRARPYGSDERRLVSCGAFSNIISWLERYPYVCCQQAILHSKGVALCLGTIAQPVVRSHYRQAILHSKGVALCLGTIAQPVVRSHYRQAILHSKGVALCLGIRCPARHLFALPVGDVAW